MTSPNDNKELLELCGKLRDGKISSEEFANLETRLLNDPSELNTYRRFMGVCSALEQSATLRGLDVADEKQQAKPRPVQRHKAKKVPTYRRHKEISFVVAAVTTMAAVITFSFLWFRSEPTDGVFATVSDVYQPVWAGDNLLQVDGDARQGQYFLASGAVQLKYANGAELLVQAPARFTLEDSKRVTLTTGVASLFIPPAATGFRIDTPFGSAIDHGTRIGVVANSETGIELHVFEGKAELVAPGKSAGQMLTADKAASLEVDSVEIADIEPEPNYFARSLDGIAELPTVSGDVEMRISPPPSVRRVQSDLVKPGRATVFAEQSAIVLAEELSVTLLSGKPTKVEANTLTLPVGQRVDSYLVHFVLPRNLWRTDTVMVAEGAIHFDKPIVAVIANQPSKSRKEFGHPATDYPGDIGTGLEDAVDGDASQADQLTISEDRHTLTFRLQIHGNDHATQRDRIDQLRVLLNADL